jgi:hypothetical protein
MTLVEPKAYRFSFTFFTPLKEITMSTSSKLTAAALSGLLSIGLIGATSVQAASAEKSATSEKKMDKHACKGQNACKGQGADGKNACKGQGSCATDGSKSGK